jgi:peptidoglycan/xylan/chitin deacetylase (PgdA/CDA1 family)
MVAPARLTVRAGLGIILAVLAAGCGSVGPPHRPMSAAARGRSLARLSPSHGLGSSPHVTAALNRFAAAGRPVYCGGQRRYAALTFDDGPGVYTPLMLRVLNSAHVPATFFLVGRLLARFHQLPRREARSAALGDHTWTHPYLPALPPSAVAAEIAKAKAAIERSAAVPVRLFRPPYGAHNALVDETARRLGLVEVLWSADSGDSLSGSNYATTRRRVEAGVRPGAIVLMHDNRGQTIRAMHFYILPALRHRHIRLVTIPQLLTLDPPSAVQLRAGLRGCGSRLPPLGRPR